MKIVSRLLIAWLCTVMVAPILRAQDAEPKPFAKEELEQLVAPIALYPDALVAQVFMASTYPLEVVSAARWSKANPKVTGKALEDAMQKQSWDPAVKSLTAFPPVLEMMNSKLDWTQKLGDAFLGQQKELMAAVQTLRLKAEAAGNLKSSEQQVVVKEVQNNTTVVKIEPSNPEVVYVPQYDPVVVYGSWPYPAYPPYYYYPPGYAPGAALLTFGVGMAVGAALWGNSNWGGGDVNINTNRYNNFNRTNLQNSNWQHRPEHRKGVGYRDNTTREKFGKGQSGAQAREGFRGRAEQGRRDIAGGAADGLRGGGIGDRGGVGDRGGIGGSGGVGDRGGIGGSGGVGDRGGIGGSGGVGDRGGIGDRGGVGDRGGIGDRGAGGGGFQGIGGGGHDTRGFSDRGAASRGSSIGGGGGGFSGARAGGGGFSGGGRAGAGGGGGGGRGGGGRR